MNCDLVRDLLPMYADSLLSESNAEQVAAHLKTCPTCRRQFTRMQEPVETFSIDKTIQEIMVSRRKEAIKKGILTGILIAALLGLIIGGWLYLEFHFEWSRFEVVSTDPELILTEVPELALTDAEIALGKIIFSLPQITEAKPAPGMTTAHIFSIPEEITNVFPEVKLIETWEYYVKFGFRTENYYTTFIYFDGDLTGNADSIVKHLSNIEEYGISDTQYSVTLYPGLLEIEYEKSELKHIWFGFLRY